MSAITIRLATPEDMPTLVHHRTAMFAEMGLGSDESRSAVEPAYATWAARKIAEGSYMTWLACDGDSIVAGLGMWILDWPPGPDGD